MAQHHVIFKYLDKLSKEVDGDINKALILNNLRLFNSSSSESDIEKRTLELAVGSDGKTDATSFKLYNSLQFNQSRFQIAILSSLGTLGGLISGTPICTILGILGLIGNFLDSSKKEFNEQEAKVLLAIYRLGKMCHISTIPNEYLSSFGTPISEEKLQVSLLVLAKFKTIEIRGDEVLIIETVNLAH